MHFTSSRENRVYVTAFLLLSLGYLLGSRVPLFDTDPAHHANIALRMFLTGDYLSLYDLGKPYLDKPHLLFWLAAFCYEIFGVNAFAYRFPTLLVGMLSFYSTYRLGNFLYGRKVGAYAAFLMASAFAYSLAHSDVRMDGMLAGFIIFSLWQGLKFEKSRSWWHFFGFTAGLSLAFMTKGMIGPVIVGIAFLFYLIEKGRWEILKAPRFWLIFPAFLFFSLPVLYAYYLQFDLHPDLQIRGQSGRSGISFILWEQSFERVEGSAFTTSRGRDPFFFLHNLLWTLIPWSLLFYQAYVHSVIKTFRKEIQCPWMTLGSIGLLLILYSFASFKLPHYLVTLIPLMALLTGYYWDKILDPSSITRIPLWLHLHWVLALLVMVLVFVLNSFVFPAAWYFHMIVALAVVLSLFAIIRMASAHQKLFWSLILSGAIINLMMQGNFYPRLLEYQSGNQLAEKVRHLELPHDDLYFFEQHSFSFDFYTAHLHASVEAQALDSLLAQKKELYLFTAKEQLQRLKENPKWNVEVMAEHPAYHVSRIKIGFLNPNTREGYLDRHYILKLQKK